MDKSFSYRAWRESFSEAQRKPIFLIALILAPLLYGAYTLGSMGKSEARIDLYGAEARSGLLKRLVLEMDKDETKPTVANGARVYTVGEGKTGFVAYIKYGTISVSPMAVPEGTEEIPVLTFGENQKTKQEAR